MRTLEAAFAVLGDVGAGPKERRLPQNPSLMAIVRSWQEGRQKSVPPFLVDLRHKEIFRELSVLSGLVSSADMTLFLKV